MAEVCAAQKDPECKETSDKCCPVCAGCGLRSLILRQINAEEAIYVCENPACSYPVGYDAKFIRRPILALLGGLGEKQGAANPSGKETDVINDGMLTAFQPLESTASCPVQRAGMCEDAPWHSTAVMDSLLYPVQRAGTCEDAPWHSTAIMDSLLDPEVANFLDSMQ